MNSSNSKSKTTLFKWINSTYRAKMMAKNMKILGKSDVPVVLSSSNPSQKIPFKLHYVTLTFSISEHAESILKSHTEQTYGRCVIHKNHIKWFWLFQTYPLHLLALRIKLCISRYLHVRVCICTVIRCKQWQQAKSKQDASYI